MNAPGRMDKPDAALELLLCDNVSEASAILNRLSKYNDLRKKTEAEISTAAIAWVKERYGEDIPRVLVMENPGIRV